MEDRFSRKGQAVSRLALLGFIFAALAGFTAVLSGFGTRWDWWHFRTGFSILRWTAYGGIAAAVISFTGTILTRPGTLRRGFVLSLSGLFIALFTFGVPLCWWWTARHVPPIHDITTDLENPPGFVSVLPLRKDAPNPVEYGGTEIAEKQKEAYPDIVPIILPLSPPQAFERAYRTALKMGWEIIDRNPREGRIEATDTTFFFGFKDDIVVRITPSGQGSRIDVRSVSRVGKSDVGTNAKRIEKYLKALAEKE
ncbi:MAG: DUF1499 domain-containing protein [Thermodesulfobacteriota bacterium]